MHDDTLWLAADYHLPATYSCRLPFSSNTHALVSPAPGPATVRLAMIRAGVELLGRNEVQEYLFPHIRSAPLYIRPPERVAISPQLLRGYKFTEKNTAGNQQIESLFSREAAHAQGTLTIYVEVPQQEHQLWAHVLQLISYWGQTNSFATCLRTHQSHPDSDECGRSLSECLQFPQISLQRYFSCILTEFRDAPLSWEDIDPFSSRPSTQDLFKREVYVWPLQIIRRNTAGIVLIRSTWRNARENQ